MVGEDLSSMLTTPACNLLLILVIETCSQGSSVQLRGGDQPTGALAEWVLGLAWDQVGWGPGGGWQQLRLPNFNCRSLPYFGHCCTSYSRNRSVFKSTGLPGLPLQAHDHAAGYAAAGWRHLHRPPRGVQAAARRRCHCQAVIPGKRTVGGGSVLPS